MSISEEIRSILGDGRLVELKPYEGTDIQYRQMFLECGLYTEITRDRMIDTDIQMYAELQADLDFFLTSEMIGPNNLFCLEPTNKGVWEIRSTTPRPQIRVFGKFAKKDVFIATHLQLRPSLGGKDNKNWNKEITKCRTIWRNLFLAYQPVISNDANNVVAGAIDERYFKQ